MKVECVNYVSNHEEAISKKKLDIWRDVIYMKLLTSDGFGSKTCDLTEKERTKRKVMKYN
jgi:hypothetical protein